MSDYIHCSVDDLQVGHTLSHSINDTNGVLLLASGQVVTEAVVERLRARGIRTILASAEDLAGRSEPPAKDPDLPDVRSVLAGPGPMPRAKELLGDPGPTLYDPEALRWMTERRQSDAKRVEKVYETVSGTDEGDGAQITEVLTSQLETLQLDVHAAVALSFDTSLESELAEKAVAFATLGMATGIDMDLDLDEVRTLGIAASLASIGMGRVDAGVRNASRELTLSERLEVEKVPGRSFDMLNQVRNVPDIVRVIAFQACERPDGSGFPRGLQGNRIHPFAHILRVTDDYRAAIEGRHRSKPESPYDAMSSLLRSASAGRLDPPAVRGLLNVLSLFPIGSFVELSDGRRARALRSNGAEYTKPLVVVMRDGDGQPVDESAEDSLVDLRYTDVTITRALDSID